MKKVFFADINKGKFTYDELYQKIRQVQSYDNVCEEEEMVSIFVKIIISLILDEELILLDSDFSLREKTKLLEGVTRYSKEVDFTDLDTIDYENLLKKKKWRLVLFTSGTTGQPKKVEHTIQTLTSNVRKADRFADNVWGFAYNPTHMAGIQVFFQALFNQNTIVDIFNKGNKDIIRSIDEFGVTNISATPTFYRLLSSCDKSFPKVRRITFGGEKHSQSLGKRMQNIFPNAKILNVYASTEAGALFASEGEEFIVNETIRPFVKIENNTLYIHKSKVAQSSSIVLDADWYNTGDMVDLIDENPLRFKIISRNNEMINTGGYKVNPHEVEEIINSFGGVQESLVYGRSNSVLGNIVCADIVCNDKIDKKDLLNFLKQDLQDFKIPRVLKFVDKLEKTRTGKIKRK